MSQANSQDSLKFQPAAALAVSGAHLVHDVYTAFLAPWLPVIVQRYGLTMTLAGLLMTMLRLPSLLNPLLGAWADRVDLRRIFVLGPVVTGLGICLLGMMPGYWGMCAALLVVGASSSIYHVVGPVLVAQASGERLGLGMSFWMTAGESARTLGPLAAVALVSLNGLEGTWPWAVVGLITTVALWTVVRKLPPPHTHQSGTLWQAWRKLAPVIGPLAAVNASRSFLTWTLMTYLPALVVDQGGSLWAGGIALTLVELTGTVGTFWGGALSDRLGRRRVLLASLGISPFCMWLFLFTTGWISWLVLAVLGLLVFASSPVMLAVVQDHAAGHRATANGLYMGVNFGISTVVVLTAGWLVDLAGFTWSFAICAGISLLALPMVAWLPRGGAQTAPEGKAA